MRVYILVNEHNDMNRFEFIGVFKTQKLAQAYSDKYKKKCDEYNKKNNLDVADYRYCSYNPVVKGFYVRFKVKGYNDKK